MIIQQTVIVLDTTYDMASLYTPTGDDLPKKINMADIAQVHHNLTRNGKRPEYILYNGMNHYNGMKRQMKSISRPRARAARSGSESPRKIITKNNNTDEAKTHDKSVGKDEQVKCKPHRQADRTNQRKCE